jgi:gamma-glutamylcyclotransferase
LSTLYFAYGSNLKAERMRERVPAARDHGRARLAGRHVRFDKPSKDGSGKANLAWAPGDAVWGFVYEIGDDDWISLDGFEPRYRRIAVEVDLVDLEATASVHTYSFDGAQQGLTPFDWYLALLVDGARAHGLPGDYVERIAAHPTRPAQRA